LFARAVWDTRRRLVRAGNHVITDPDVLGRPVAIAVVIVGGRAVALLVAPAVAQPELVAVALPAQVAASRLVVGGLACPQSHGL